MNGGGVDVRKIVLRNITSRGSSDLRLSSAIFEITLSALTRPSSEKRLLLEENRENFGENYDGNTLAK